MADLIPDPPPSSLDDHIGVQATRLICLLESINYPHEISPQDLFAAVAAHYLRHQQDGASVGDQPNLTAKFLDWLVDNVSAESNWPGYQQHQHLTEDHPDVPQDDMGDSESDRVLEDLDLEFSQLQNTLSSLEKELADLKTLETHVTDANKILDMDIHNSSLQLDATASKLVETAQIALSEYTAALHHPPQGHDSMDMDTDRDRDQASLLSSSKRFLYQCPEELLQIQKLDTEYLKAIDLHFQQTVNHIDLATNDSSTGPLLSHLEWLLKRDPVQDQELVRLCSTYRATKMSHIRAMAQLKCLEEELGYMKELDTKHQLSEEIITDQDMTGDNNMYSIASSRNQQIQQTRQQEIELIS
ncbi:hypothetical protein BGZ65_002072, partial [Modicella reniformis]